MENTLLYGPTDCMMNVVITCLHHKKMKFDQIYTYNFDIRCIFENKRLSGSISILNLFEFIRRNFGIDSIELMLDDIHDHEYIAAYLDLYSIENSPYYQKHHLGHYMLVKIMNKVEVEIYEPYMDIRQIIPYNKFLGSVISDQSLYAFIDIDAPLHQIKSIPKPYIISADYTSITFLK